MLVLIYVQNVQSFYIFQHFKCKLLQIYFLNLLRIKRLLRIIHVFICNLLLNLIQFVYVFIFYFKSKFYENITWIGFIFNKSEIVIQVTVYKEFKYNRLQIGVYVLIC